MAEPSRNERAGPSLDDRAEPSFDDRAERSLDDENVRAILAGEEAWIVGGAVRDLLLGRPLLDLDVACADPRGAAMRYAKRFGGAAFALSTAHGAWRVARGGDRATVDFTPLADGIEADLASRDFTFNAIALPLGGDESDERDAADPFGGR